MIVLGKRVEWIDSLKGFAIFCVTFGHLACDYSIEKHIYSFHMFLFFFVSGYLHHDESGSVWSYILKKAKTILVPFLCWNLLSILLEICFQGYSPGLLKELILLKGSVVWNKPIWFLWVLFMTEVIFGVLKRKLPYCNIICLVVALVCGYQFAEHRTTLLLNLIPISLFAFSLGNSFRQIPEKINGFLERNYIDYGIMLALLAVNIWLGVFSNIRIIYTVSNFGNYTFFILSAMAGTLFYVLLFRRVRWLAHNKVLTYIGKKSLNIMAMQYMLFTIYDTISVPFFDMSLWYHRSTVKALLVSVLTIFLICAFTEGMKKLEKRWRVVFHLRNLLGIR